MPPAADTKPAPTLPLAPLSATQRTICELLIDEECSLKEVAERVGLKEDSMKYHKAELRWKFRCQTWERICVEFDRARNCGNPQRDTRAAA